MKFVDKVYGKVKDEFRFRRQFKKFKSMSTDERFEPDWNDRYPCLDDAVSTTTFDRHYVYHTSWAARILAREKIAHHVDISSDLRFVTLISAFVDIAFYDYRPADIKLPGLSCHGADINDLPIESGSVSSLSCMHVLEHIGLARYGDKLDVTGDQKAAAELIRILAENGLLLVAVPVGVPKVMFNAHRIYSYEMVLKLFNGLTLLEFSLVSNSPKDEMPLRIDADPSLVASLTYGCGCFLFTKN